jgi:hypothetical protein
MKAILRSKRILTFVTLAMVAAALVILPSGSVKAASLPVTVMTQNMDEGIATLARSLLRPHSRTS